MQQSNEHPARVAYDLMLKISQQEYDKGTRPTDIREYYLKLYVQCLKAASGDDYEDIIDSDESEAPT